MMRRSRPWLHGLALSLLLVPLACGDGAGPKDTPASAATADERADSTEESSVRSPGAAASPSSTSADRQADGEAGETEPSAATAPVRVVFLGDSITAGYTLGEEQAFPYLAAEALRQEGLAVEAINAGVSGDTSAGGLRRMEWLMRQEPDLLVVELGANDGLRGLPLEATEENLRSILQQAREGGARVLLLGMRIPPNYGEDYAEGFASIFPRLAEELDVPLMPFLLEDVGGREALNLQDGIHPNPEGHRILAQNLLPYLEPLVRGLQGRKRP